MNFSKIIFLLPVFLVNFLVMELQAQSAIGKWKTHFAYNSVQQTTQSENKVFAISDGALYSIDKTDGNLEFYSKSSGLNGAAVARVEYDSTDKKLLIIYSNGNMDVLYSGGINNMPDLYNKQMSATKDVNDVYFVGNKAFLSCNFGIVVLNMEKEEVADTYYIGANATEVKVFSTTIFNNKIYAVTATDLYQADATSPYLANYAYWSTSASLPGTGNLQKVVSFSGQLFLLRNGKIYKKDSSGAWSAFLSSLSVTGITVSNDKLFVFTSAAVTVVDTSLATTTINNTGTVSDAEYDTAGNLYWLAGNTLGVESYNVASSSFSYYKPAGPAVNYPWKMTFAGEKLFVVPGGRWAAQYNRLGYVMIYENGSWRNLSGADIAKTTGHSVLDFMNVAVDPNDSKHFFVTSYGTGLYEFKNDAYSGWYNHLNSPIETIYPASASGQYLYMRLDGGVFDKSGNLFFTNSMSSYGIKVLTASGSWLKLTYPGVASDPTLGDILINSQDQDQKWVLANRSHAICVFDDNGTLSDQTDDKSVVFSTFADPDNSGSYITPAAIYSIAQDKDGVIWVGTEIGPILFYNTENVFKSGYTCSRVKIPRNDGTNLADYLLANEKVKSIAIDGANRKWLGTESSGAYLMSADGKTTIQHFTTTNSPLLSNDIISISINPVSGEVFFGTGGGLVSYQSDAADASDKFGDVHAYPNPVRENYNGIITITGLVESTQVKITDLNGNLVCETVSNGSLATWDGKDAHGRKVSTGVYLDICTSSDGSQSAITKILVIN